MFFPNCIFSCLGSLGSSARGKLSLGLLCALHRRMYLALLGLVVFFAGTCLPAHAGQTISVANGDVAGLVKAIQTLNANGGGTIDLAAGGTYSLTTPSDWWYGPNAFPAISTSITINGNGATISRVSGSPKFRFFYVSGGISTLAAGSLTLNSLTLSGGLAQGGSGGAGCGGGGGGGGFGGAIYNQGALNLTNVALTSNTAQGGSSGTGNCGYYAAGSGGGLGGNGANSNGGPSAGGGGGGFKEDGTVGPDYGNGGPGGGFLGSEGGGAGTAGTSSYGGNGGSGSGCGGGGGGGFEVGENGGVPTPEGSVAESWFEGGPGAQGGGQGGTAIDVGSGCGGGGGAFGGGGGGGYGNDDGAGGGGGVGGGGGGGGFSGGSGGFGGGGGGGGSLGTGLGGFGAGGGGGANVPNGGTVFGGGGGISSPNGNNSNGGGGAGFGGAIFNHLGTANIAGTDFTSNSAAGSGGGGTARGFGGAIFNLNGTVALDGVTYSGNTAVDSTNTADGGAFVYNLSHIAGIVAGGQWPTASLVLTNTTISTSNGDLTNNQVNGTATVTTDSPTPLASLNQSALNFGSNFVDYPIPAQSVTLTNVGGVALSISSVTLTGSSQFSMTGKTCGSTLAAGASCQVTISLKGSPNGSFTGVLTFADNSADGSTQTVSLTGTRVLQSPVTQLVFASAPPANVWPLWNAPSVFTVIEETATGAQNYSGADVIWLAITGPGSFSKSYSTLASEGIATFNLSGIQLITPGTYTYTASSGGTLTLTQAMATQTVASGTVGATSAPSTFTLTFADAGTVASIDVLTQGAPELDFASSSGGTCVTGTTYAIGQTCTLNVTFTATVPGVRYGAAVLQNSTGNPLATSYFQTEGFGPQINYLPGTQVAVAPSAAVGQADGVAVDGAGNVYVVDSSNYALLEAAFSGGSYSVNPLATSTPSGTNGVAVDGAGNIYLTDFGNNRILKETPVGGGGYLESSISSSNIQDPCGVAVDGAGNVYVADSAVDQILKETPSGNTYTESTVPVSNPTYPSVTCGVAADGDGNVYIPDVYNVRLLKETLSGGSYTESTLPIPSGFAPSGVALDAYGNVYFIASNNQVTSVYKDTLTSSGSYTLSTVPISGVCYPAGVAVDGSGNVYVTDAGSCNAAVLKQDFADPPSLNFPTSTPAGAVDSADGAQTVNILNIGNQPLAFTTPSTGANPSYPANFPANTSDSNLCTSITPVAQSASCDVSVNFMPTSGGINTGNVVLTDNALNATNGMQSIALSGAGFGTQTITFTPPTSPAYYGVSTITLVATGGASGNLVTFSIVSGPGSLSGTNNSVLKLTGIGTIVIAANQAGNTGYAAAPQVTESIVVLAPPLAALTSPAVGSTLAGPTVTFAWSRVSGVNGYFLHLGTTGAGSSNLLNSAEYSNTTSSVTVNSLPPNGETIYARLFTDYNGTHLYQDYTFTASTQAGLTSPGTSGTLAGPSVTFGWSAATGNPYGYFLHLGTTGAGSDNLVNSSEYSSSTTSVTINNLPVNGETIYARVLTDYNGTHLYQDYVFTAASQALLTSPLQGASVIGPTVTFDWSAATGTVNGYFLHVGTTGPGSMDLLNSAEYPTGTTSVTINNLPVGGGTIYARMFTDFNGTHLYQDYTFTALPAQVTLSAISLDFPATSVGSSSASQSVTMTNTGTTTLTITSIAMTGTNASQFVFANSCGTSLAAGANCTIHGHFAPTAVGAATASVTITDSASKSPQSIALTGTGVGPLVTLSATSLAFGSISVGKTSGSQTVTPTNSGTAPMSITSLVVTGTNASAFGFANSCGTSLAAGANCTIHGHFAPTAAGAMTASITITDSATGSPQNIALSGTGQ